MNIDYVLRVLPASVLLLAAMFMAGAKVEGVVEAFATYLFAIFLISVAIWIVNPPEPEGDE